MYFHANAEDIGNSFQIADSLRKMLKINVLIPEFPGYGIYKNTF